MNKEDYFKTILDKLKTFNHLDTDGFFIAKIEIKKKDSFNNLEPEIKFFNKLELSFIEIYSELNPTQTISIQLIKQISIKSIPQNTKSNELVSPSIKPDKYFIFSAKMLVDFLDTSLDRNYIHQGENPVIPALMIVEFLIKENYIKEGDNFLIKFFKPLLLNDGFMINLGQNKIEGLNFTGKLFEIKIHETKLLHH